MRRKRVLFLTNVSAGKGDAEQKLYPIIRTLAENHCEVTVYPIIPEQNLTAERILREGFPEEERRPDREQTPGGYRFDVILCCGGDGTLNHVINALMNLGLNKGVPIGYIPSGSTNDFSKNLNGNLSTEEICRAVAGEKKFAYDIGLLHEEEDRPDPQNHNNPVGCYFNYVAGFGAFTQISYSTSQSFKNVFGYGAYILTMIATLPQNMAYKQHVVVEHDGSREEDDYIFGGVTNSLSLAGVESPILGSAALNDGLFEVLLIKAPADLIEISEIINTLSKGSTNNQYVKVFHTNHVVFHCSRALDWTLDGEYGGSYRNACVDVYPQAVQIMVKDNDENDA